MSTPRTRTWTRPVYTTVATLARQLLGPTSNWTKKVKILKKNGALSPGHLPTGPEHMSDEDIKAAWELILEAASVVAKANGLVPPSSETACYHPIFYVCYDYPNSFNNPQTFKAGLGYMVFAQVALSVDLINADQYDRYVRMLLDSATTAGRAM